jgi:hypothetical protein
MIHSWQMATSKRIKNNILPASLIINDNIITMEEEKKLKEKQLKELNNSLTKQLIEVNKINLI